MVGEKFMTWLNLPISKKKFQQSFKKKKFQPDIIFIWETLTSTSSSRKILIALRYENSNPINKDYSIQEFIAKLKARKIAFDIISERTCFSNNSTP